VNLLLIAQQRPHQVNVQLVANYDLGGAQGIARRNRELRQIAGADADQRETRRMKRRDEGVKG